MTDPTGPPEKPDDNIHSPWSVTFQPDTAALLNLLGSAAMYGTPLMAVRELVQNAFDAVLMANARARVALPPEVDTVDPFSGGDTDHGHQVTLFYFERNNRSFLRCSDSGIGLDVQTVSRRILRPGQKASAGFLNLALACQARGFRLPGSSRRGLGFLSYFMLADAVKLRSRPMNAEGIPNGEPAEFLSEGPMGRNLLRQMLPDSAFLPPPFQTSVTLRLDPAKIQGMFFSWLTEEFLEENLVRTPAPLILSAEFGERTFPAGWHPATPTIRPQVIRPEPASITLRRLPTTSATLDLVTAIQSIPAGDLLASGVLTGMDCHEYHAPGLATIRCTAPWITYRGIRAMVWATDADPDHLGKYTMIHLAPASRTAWRGMHCHIAGAPLPGISPSTVLDSPPSDSYVLPPWGFLTLDVDLDEPPVDLLPLNRLSVTLTVESRDRLEEFCLKCLTHMASFVKHKYPGTLLAEQMVELEALMHYHYPGITARRRDTP